MEEKLKRIRLEKVWRNFCGEDLWEIVLNEFEEPQLKQPTRAWHKIRKVNSENTKDDAIALPLIQQGLDDNIFSKRLQ